MTDIRTHYRSCNLCEAICGLEIQWNDREILSIKGDPKDPLSKGHICPKAVALKDIFHDKDRLKYPIRKIAGGWEEISWEVAFDEVASNLQGIQREYGNDSVGVYSGNPNVHNLGSMLFASNFIKSLGTKNKFSATSADQLPHQVVALLQFGHVLMIPVPDIDRTDFLLILGGNPLVSNGSMMTAPGFAGRMKGIQKRGGKVVVVDPRHSETAAKADEHFFIQPGRDALLLLSLIHTVFVEKLSRLRHLEEQLEGLQIVEAIANDFSPEKVAALLGIEAGQIRQLARDFAAAPSAVCYGRMGVSTQAFGGLCQWLINVLNIITGNLDREGGAMFSLPAFDLVGMTGAMGKTGVFGRHGSRVRGLPEFSGELPVAAMAEEILTQGEGQIKAMVTIAGNPVLSTPNGNLLDKAFSQLEFMVSIDIYLNESTRHANIILPPTTGLETSHYDLIFHVLAVRNTAKYAAALFEKKEKQRHDWEIFKALTECLSGRPDDGSSPETMLDFVLQSGPYGKNGMSLDRLKEAPHGIDLGPLKPCLPQRLFTKDKKIQLAPELLTSDIERLKGDMQNWQESNGDFPFSLIGRRQLRSNNSWMHNSYRLVKGIERCTLLIHPQDAEKLQIRNGQLISVSSRVGAIKIKAEINDAIIPGVVSIPHGWGHLREGIQMETARQHAGVSINDLTDDQLVDELTGNAAFSGLPVRIGLA